MNAMTIPGLDSWKTNAPAQYEPQAWEIAKRADEVLRHWKRDPKRYLEKFTEALLNVVYTDPAMARLFALFCAGDKNEFGTTVDAVVVRELQQMAESYAYDDLTDVLGSSDENIPWGEGWRRR